MATLDFDALHPRWQPRFENVPNFAITDLPLQIFTDIYKSITLFKDQYRYLQININIDIYRSAPAKPKSLVPITPPCLGNDSKKIRRQVSNIKVTRGKKKDPNKDLCINIKLFKFNRFHKSWHWLFSWPMLCWWSTPAFPQPASIDWPPK